LVFAVCYPYPSPTAWAHTAPVDGNPQETGFTAVWPPKKPILNLKDGANLDVMTILVSKNLPIFGALTSTSYHPRGDNTLYTDGSVHFLKSAIHGLVWRALGTVSDAEVVSADGL
jgi:hypothetical protein